MSGIAGRLHLDGSPVEAARLAAMAEAIAHRGEDHRGLWHEGPVGLAHGARWTTPEAEAERQPLVDARANLALVFDGRLDGREALAHDLRAKGCPPRDDTDAELVLRAYEAWAEGCADRLLGDFAFAIWDGARRRLYAARDPIGIRPLHYAADGQRFAFGSEMAALLADPSVPTTPDDAFARDVLAVRIRSTTGTLFRDIRRLPGGHWLTVEAQGGRVRTERYWRIDFARRLAYRTDAEYGEHFRELMRSATRARLRVRGALGAELSGGHDSSTVVAFAHDLLREGAARVERFRTYSIVYPGLACDESALIDATLAAEGLEGERLERSALPIAEYARIVDETRDFPGYPNGTPELAALARAERRDGCRVVLTGTGGNECWEGGLEPLADLAAAGRPLAAWRGARANREAYGCSAARLFWRHALRPLARRPEPAGASYAQAEMVQRVLGGEEAHSLELLEREAGRLGIELRHPMLDRRVLEFSFALPGAQKWRDGRLKPILVHAMEGRLPRPVLERSMQADFTAVVVDAVEAARQAWPMRDWHAGRLGWIDAARLERDYEAALAAFRASGTLSVLFRGAWAAYGVSLWAARQGR